MENHYFIQKSPINTQKCNKKSNFINKMLIVFGFVMVLAIPSITHAQVIMIDGVDLSNLTLENNEIKINKSVSTQLPVVSSKKPVAIVNMVITAYTSQVAQTDDSPCITASGMDVCERGAEDIVATNFNWLPFGTKLKIPELFGDRVFIIHDRMNSRYSKRVDVWMKSYADAVKFGKKYTAVEIY